MSTTEQLKTQFDVFVSEINTANTASSKISKLKEITAVLINLPNKCEQLVIPELITHQLMICLRDYVIIDQLHRRQTKDVDYDLLVDSSKVLANICFHIDHTNFRLLEEFLFENRLIDELSSCFLEMSSSGKHLDNPKFLNSIQLILNVFRYYEGSQTETDKSTQSTPLVSAVIGCLCSQYTVDALTKLEHNFSQNLNEIQTLLFDVCPHYLSWLHGNRNPELFIQIPRTLLHPFTTWITNCKPDCILNCSDKMSKMMRHMNNVLVRPINWEIANMSSKEFHDDYYQLVKQSSLFLQKITEEAKNTDLLNSLIEFIAHDLYNFTFHPNLVSYMKECPGLISLLRKMADSEKTKTQLNAFRCLGKIMTEDDIKTMNNPDKIAIIHVKLIAASIDDPLKKERFYNLLESLKNWVQHDQVKVDVINQQALPILVRSVLESKFDSLKVHKPALEILMALSFTKAGSLYLKENQQFMSYIQNLSTDTDIEKAPLQRAAEALLWKLEKETEAVSKPTVRNSYQYDVMISYSHSDKNLCHQIYDRLVKDEFRVWIDKEDMHGTTMVAMANAVENSNIVLICMSDTYKQSVYCQAEAQYAFERRCRIIPLMVRPKYKPDGWLGIMVSGKLYVPFTKMDFKEAYQQLKTEINRHRRQTTNQTITDTKERDHQNNPALTTQRIEKYLQPIDQYKAIELPHCIYQWTQAHVQSFFISIGLKNTLFLLCTRMDGYRLLQLYEICMINRESMFQSLKAELAEVHHELLPIDHYITFLLKLKIYVPINTIKYRTTQPEPVSPVVCSLM